MQSHGRLGHVILAARFARLKVPSFKLSPLRNARCSEKREHIEVLKDGGYEALQAHLAAEHAADTNGNGGTP